MDTTHWRRLTGHWMVCGWLLWHELEVWAGPGQTITRGPDPARSDFE
jgi:hypothetical protein